MKAMSTTPHSTHLVGRWRQRRGLGDTVLHQVRATVPRCMTCQIHAQRQKEDQAALDALVNDEMVRLVTAWLQRKGLT